MFRQVASDTAALPGVVLSVQSYGDRLNLHPHVHALAGRGVWSADGSFEAIPALDTLRLMLLFRHRLLKSLLACGRIGQATLDILDRFHHPGFSAYEGEGVSAGDSAARERLASYLVHPAFSLARLRYERDAGVVTYDARTPSRSHPSSPSPERFTPLDALAALTSFIPEKGQQIVRYYGYYSNKARGLRRRQQCTVGVTSVAACGLEAAEDDDFRRHARRAWARLIRKVYLANPLACPKCGGTLRIIAFIDGPPVIEKILRHLKLWDSPERPPPPRPSRRLQPDEDFLAWEARGRLWDGIG